MEPIVRWLVLSGLILILIGGALWLVPFGKLPGDFTFRKGGVVFMLPLATSLIVTLLLNVLLWILRK